MIYPVIYTIQVFFSRSAQTEDEKIENRKIQKAITMNFRCCVFYYL